MGKLVLGGVLLVAAFFLMVARAGMAGRPAGGPIRAVALFLAAIGVAFVLAYIVLSSAFIALIILAGQAQAGGAAVATLVLLWIVTIVLLAIIHAALAAIYSAALYRFAAEGDAGEAFGGDTLKRAFQPKLIS